MSLNFFVFYPNGGAILRRISDTILINATFLQQKCNSLIPLPSKTLLRLGSHRYAHLQCTDGMNLTSPEIGCGTSVRSVD
mmetsp:Transcript_27552/g.32146  ORF Transcript_27552/g.32146 Transcript_27552/m.32146 type:complete len:80 (+) Transcript_27552:350-589(+)